MVTETKGLGLGMAAARLGGVRREADTIPPRSLRPPEAPGRAHTIGAWSRRELGRVVTIRPLEPEVPKAHARSIHGGRPSVPGEKVTTLVGPGGGDAFGPAGLP